MSYANAYKKVVPVEPSVSFAAAVREMGDLWRYSSHLPWSAKREMPSAESTPDRRDAAAMACMELGMHPRVFEPSTRDLDAYERIHVGEAGFAGMWSATRESYDGAPDSHCPHGTGWSRYAAIADLIEQECERNEERRAHELDLEIEADELAHLRSLPAPDDRPELT
jgi:hypothetical protein